MQLKYGRHRVYENIEVSKNIYRLWVEGEFAAVPGQFYMLRAWGMEPLLSRPISIHDVGDGKISFLYEVKGEGTKLLSKLKNGDEIELLGPSGNGFPIESINGRIAVVAGGIGIAPMLYTVKSIKNVEIDLFAGFRDSSYLIHEFKQFVKDVHISTESGREGHKGYVTDMLNPKEYGVILCCGPKPMMERVVKMCKEDNVPVYVSLEARMACGVGACLGCMCKTREGNKRTCKDGPVFKGEGVVFDA